MRFADLYGIWFLVVRNGMFDLPYLFLDLREGLNICPPGRFACFQDLFGRLPCEFIPKHGSDVLKSVVTLKV
ncbi:hypothetical protein CEQ30_19575 [Nocardia brasiliensis]|nr:hypothetical protein CEQ30_19575 [Nocardia brasiliensis]